MAYGTPKKPGSTIVTRKYFIYMIGTAAIKLNVTAPRIPMNNKNRGVTWKEFKAAICCLVPDEVVSFKRDDDVYITFKEAEAILCCIWDYTVDTILIDEFPTDADVTVGGTTETDSISNSIDLGILIILAYTNEGEQSPGVSITETPSGSSMYKIVLTAGPGDSLLPATITIDGNTIVVTPTPL